MMSATTNAANISVLVDHGQKIVINTYQGKELQGQLPVWEQWFETRNTSLLSQHPRWMTVLSQSFDHTPICIAADSDGLCEAILPLCFMKSLIFGRFLVSLPYLNSNGILGGDDATRQEMIRVAVDLSNSLDVKHLQLRHEKKISSPLFNHELTSKVHMRLDLPRDESKLWKNLKSKVRSQVRKGMKQDVKIIWGGGAKLIDDFYYVFCRNMRDLGTPVYSKLLFASILNAFPDQSELCVCRFGNQPVAGALLLHGKGITEVPSASSLREYNSTNVNMLMYWNLLKRSVERNQNQFDFGRTSEGSPTYRFKKQWGASPYPASWQYYVRKSNGAVDFRPESSTYARAVRVWRQLPLFIANKLGPKIVRGIP